MDITLVSCHSQRDLCALRILHIILPSPQDINTIYLFRVFFLFVCWLAFLVSTQNFMYPSLAANFLCN